MTVSALRDPEMKVEVVVVVPFGPGMFLIKKERKQQKNTTFAKNVQGYRANLHLSFARSPQSPLLT